MNEEALNDAYKFFTDTGYDGSIEDYKILIDSNPEALQDSYKFFTDTGYNGSIEDFTTLLGVKKKDSSDLPITSPPQDVGSPGNEVVEEEVSLDISPNKKETDVEVVEELVSYDSNESTPDDVIKYDKNATQFEKSLAYITPDLIDRNEEEVVSRMNYHFSDYGFEFEEGATLTTGFDGMTVRASNGKTLTVNLDPIFNDIFGGLTKGSKELIAFLEANRRSDDVMEDLYTDYDLNRKKYFSSKAAMEDLQDIQGRAKQINKRTESYLQKNTAHEQAIESLLNASDAVKQTSEWKLAYNNQLEVGKRLNEIKNIVGKDLENYNSLSTQVNSTVGNYLSMKEQQGTAVGTFFGGLYNSFMSKGVGKILAGALGTGIEAVMELNMSLEGITGVNPIKTKYRKEKAIEIAKDMGYDVPENVLESQENYDNWLNGLDDKDLYERIEGEELNAATGTINQQGKKELKESGSELRMVNGNLKVFNPKGGILGNGDFTEIPESWLDKTGKEKINRLVKDAEIKMIKNPAKDAVKNALAVMFELDGVSDERLQNQLAQEGATGILLNGLIGTAESGPAILTSLISRGKIKATGVGAGLRNKLGKALGLSSGGAVAQTLSFSLLQAEAMNEEMNLDPDFKYITESERKKIVLPTAITVGILERYGLRNLVKSKTIMTGLMKQATKAVPKGAPKGAFGRAVEKIVKSNLAKGIYTNKAVKGAGILAKATLAEAETGGLQQIAEMGYKSVWNDMYQKDMFDQPDFFTDQFYKEVAYAAATEAVGGFVLGIPQAIVYDYNNNPDLISDEALELFDMIRADGITVKAYSDKLDSEVAAGTITKEEAAEQLLEFNTLSGAANSIPIDLDVKSRKEAIGLVFEKQKLETEMENMDKDLGLYKDKESRVAEIKTELNTLGSTQAQENVNLKEEEEGIQEADLITKQDAKNSLKKQGINNPTNKQIKTEQDALQIASTEKMVSEEFTGSGQEVGSNVQQSGSTNKSKTKGKESEKKGKNINSEEEVTKEDRDDIDAFYGDNVSESVETPTSNLRIDNKQEKGNELKDTKLAQRIINIAKKGAKAIQKIAPNVKIVLHKSNKEFEKYAPKGKGYYNPSSGIIHINLTNAKASTVAHEIFHAVFLAKIAGGDKGAIATASKLILSVRKTLPKDSLLAKRIDAFAKAYEGNPFQNEEEVAELFGIMASEYKTLTKPSKNKVIEFIRKLAKKFGINIPSNFTSTDEAVVDFLNTFSQKVRTGEEVVDSDLDALSKLNKEVGLDINQEQGSEGQVGTFTFTGRQQKAPIISNDKREFSSLIKEKNIEDFKGEKFITNMYDFTSAGPTQITDGITLELYGGKNYVPLMMQNQNLKLGDVSNLAAFNSQAQAEGFIRNSKESGATLFAPHVGTKEGSWQFQQNIFEQLTFAALDNKILTNTALINTFNEALNSKEGVAAFNTFKKKLGKNIKNLNSFKSNPKELLELLDINNNYSPDLRKLLNDKLSANKAYQEALGVKNKNEFAQKLEDPLNIGSKGGDIIGIVEFDNSNFEIVKPNPGDTDYHPSFAYTIKTKINGIYQPTNFYQSSQVTDSYTKYNKQGAKISTKENTKDFEKSNVSSSAGSIPKVAQVNEQAGRQQKNTEQNIIDQTGMPNSGYYSRQAMVSDIQRQWDRVGPGYKAIRAKEGAFGGGGGVYVKNPSGKRIIPKMQGRQQKMDNQNDLLKIIIAGREEAGFKDAAIKDYLQRRKKNLDGKSVPEFKLPEINNAFAILNDIVSQSDYGTYLFSEFPKSFNNIEGGFLAGLKLMRKVNSYYKKLIQANNEKKSVLVKGQPLTEEQIREKVIEYFTSLSEYQNEGAKGGKLTSQQMAMEKDILEMLLPDPLKANPQRIKDINKRIREIKFDEKNLKNIQRALRNYIRSVLPRDLYKKGEIDQLINKINRVNKNNFESVKKEVFKIVTTKTNNSLQTSLNKILAKSYEIIQSGRLKGVKIDEETRKKLDRIKGMILNPEATADEINAANKKLLEQFNEISKENIEIETGGIVKQIFNKTKTLTRSTVKSGLSTDNLSKMSELTLAMQINNSFLQEMNDPNKTTLLSEVISSLNQIEETGRANLEYQLLEDAIMYRENERLVFKEMTGINLDGRKSLIAQGIPENQITEGMVNEEFAKMKKDISLDQKRSGGLTAKTVSARFKQTVLNMLKKVESATIGTAEDLTGLITRISTQPGEVFGGAIQELVSDRVRKGTRIYKARMLNQQFVFSDKMTELFGNKWVKINRKNSQETETLIISESKNQFLLNKIKEIEKNNSVLTSELKEDIKEINKKIDQNTLNISQNQLLYYYSQMQDPSLKQSMINTFNPTENYDNEFEFRIKKEIEEKLDPRLIQFSKWMIEDYYPSVYGYYNETYKQIYRTDMPWNQFYAGRVYRTNEDDAEGLDLLAGSNSWITNVAAASSKSRIANANPINKSDGIDALLNYTKDMEYFAAYALPIRDINKIFTSPAIKETIDNKFGKDISRYINDAIEKIANKGVQNQRNVNLISFFNNTFLFSRLGLNPTLILKQMTSFVTYANDIGYINWLKNRVTSIGSVKSTVKEIMNNSVVLQDRYNQPITRAIESYSDSKFEKMNGGMLEAFGLNKQNLDTATRVLMWTTMQGDKGAILFGGVPNYLFYKKEFKKNNPKATEQEVIDYAIIKFEADTLRTQQSYDLQDKDYYQTKGAFTRAFNMFLTTPKQYFRREIISARNIYRYAKSGGQTGKGTLFENIRTFATYHVVMPVFFQWVSQGLPGLARDFDEEDAGELGMAAVLGNINALFILGNIVESARDAYLGKPWAAQAASIPVLSQTANLSRLYLDFQKTKNPAKKREKWNKMLMELITVTGVPAPQLKKFIENWGSITDSRDFGQFVLKLFNFSQYAQGNKKKKSGLKLTSAEKKKYMPDLYQKEKDLEERLQNNPAYKKQQEFKQKQKDLRKRLLDQMYNK